MQKDESGRPIFLLELGKAIRANSRAEMEKTLQHSIRSAEIAESIGDLRAWGTAIDLAAWAQQSLCRLEEAVETRREMISVGEEASDPQVVCWALFGLGPTQIRLGQIDEAINNLIQAIDIADELPDHRTKVTAGAWLARTYVAKGDLDQALKVLELSQESSAALGANIAFSSYLNNALAETYLTYAEGSTGETSQDWLRKAKRTCREALKSTRNNWVLLPEALQFQGRYEWLNGNPDTARKWWQQGLEKAQVIDDPYFQGKIHLEIGQRTGDRKHLQAAESILEEIGSELLLEQARLALSNLEENEQL
jgi:tetratricopeptide (TPR) repeat protein